MASPIATEPRSLSARLCLALARSFLNGRLRGLSSRNRASMGRFESNEKYVDDCVSNVEGYRELFSGFGDFQDKTVLELGCSEGYLLSSFLEQERFAAKGVDIDARALALGRTRYGDRIELLQNTPSTIPLPDQSVDVIYSIDTFEHLSSPFEISLECYRVLRPGGLFFIHFGPWLGPDGSHLEDIITFPWPHVFFSMDTLLSVAAYLYDSEGYTPVCYWLDPETGQRRPNPYLDRENWREFLNQMTVARFKKLARRLPFEQVHFRCIGFGGKNFRAGVLVRRLARTPFFNEFFTRTLFCVLRKPLEHPALEKSPALRAEARIPAQAGGDLIS